MALEESLHLKWFVPARRYNDQTDALSAAQRMQWDIKALLKTETHMDVIACCLTADWFNTSTLSMKKQLTYRQLWKTGGIVDIKLPNCW